MIDGHRNTFPLSSSDFADWLLHRFFMEMQKAPGLTAMKTAIRTLGAHARFKGQQREVFLRVTTHEGRIYLDIGDPNWHVVEIDAIGWRLIEDSPVRFRREQGMQALPIPERGGSIDQLRSLVNLSDDGFVLFVSYILDALCPHRPHPVLYLAGEAGVAKTMAGNIARSLTDPSEIPLQNLPTKVRDLFVDAYAGHVLAYDNISSISPAISDAICQITTGGGFGTRRLYSDLDRILIGGYRPVVLAGLQNAIDRSDLAERAVVVSMQHIAAERRRSEAEMWACFQENNAKIFGALLDRIACGLQRLPNVRLSHLPRMADFALWSVATEAFPPGVFIEAFAGAAADAVEAVAEVDPVVVAIRAFMMGRESWTGTAAALLGELSNHDRTEAAPSKWSTWPRDVSSFGKRLRSASSVLRKTGVEVVIGRAPDRSRTRTITLRKNEVSQSMHVVPSDAADASDGFDIEARNRPGARSPKKRAGRRRHPRARAVR